MVSSTLKPNQYKSNVQITSLAPIFSRMKDTTTSGAEGADPSRNRGKWYCSFLSCILFVIYGAAMVSGARSLRSDFKNAYRWASPTQSKTMKRQIAEINTVLPVYVPLFYIINHPDPIIPILWQRGMYPRPVFRVTADQLLGSDGAKLKAKYSIRYAMSVGMPPSGVRWIHSRNIDPPDGDRTIILGELAR
jgi:hypothetical protein